MDKSITANAAVKYCIDRMQTNIDVCAKAIKSANCTAVKVKLLNMQIALNELKAAAESEDITL